MIKLVLFYLLISVKFYYLDLHCISEDLDWFLTDRWAGQALFGTLTPDIIVLTLLYSIAGVCNILHGTLLDMNMIICQIRMVINTVVVSHCSWELLLSMTSKVLKGIGL